MRAGGTRWLRVSDRGFDLMRGIGLGFGEMVISFGAVYPGCGERKDTLIESGIMYMTIYM
jgi:hypothetical protein